MERNKNVYKSASLAYLNQWYTLDRYHIDALRVDDIAAYGSSLLKLASDYSVRRGLGMRAVEEERRASEMGARLESIALEIKRVTTQPTGVGSKDVWKLGEVIGDRFRKLRGDKEINTNQLSAASKFLWFAGVFDVRIFDSQAYAALYGCRPPYGRMSAQTYEDFCVRWQKGYSEAKPQLKKAVKSLSYRKMLEWSVVPSDDIDFVIETIAEPWFQERVYDKHLWTVGAAKLNELDLAIQKVRLERSR